MILGRSMTRLIILLVAAMAICCENLVVTEARRLMHTTRTLSSSSSSVSSSRMQQQQQQHSESSSSTSFSTSSRSSSSSSSSFSDQHKDSRKSKWDPLGDHGDPAGYGAYGPPSQTALTDPSSSATSDAAFYTSEHLVPSGPDPLHN